MELEFEQSTICGYELVGSVCLRQEETLESIVPDACPDILRIVDVCGQATLLSREARERTTVVNGIVRAVILYKPDQGDGLRWMEVGIPFTCQADTPGLTEQGIVLARPRLCSAEARTLNSRKVLLRVDLAVDVISCQKLEQNVCSAVSDPSDHSICQQQYQGEHYHLAAVQEKAFAFSERIRLQGVQGDGSQILSVRAQAVCTENKLIGTKLIFKGTIHMTILMQEGSGLLTAYHEAMPFSQVMETPEAGEQGECIVFTEVAQVDWTPCADDDRCLDVSLELLAQGQVYSRCPITLLRDLYSTKRQTDVQQDVLTICHLEETSVRTQSVRDLMEVQGSVHSIIDCSVVLGSVTQTREGEEIILNSEAWISVLCFMEEGGIRCIRKHIPVFCRYRCAEPLVCRCISAMEQGVFAVPAAGGIEVRFNADFVCQTLTYTPVPVVRSAKLGDMRNSTEEPRPSIVLRLAEQGEGFWELAKAYGTTMDEIRQANELDGEQPPPGHMLLIPGCR